VLQERLRRSTGDDERAAFQILLKAMEAPLRTIVANAGCDASEVMAEIRLAGAGHGFDVTTEQVVDVREAGIVDAAGVVKTGAFAAISSAALALTVDVIVHHREAEREFQHEPARRKRL
jgi:chaperonin GroEL